MKKKRRSAALIVYGIAYAEEQESRNAITKISSFVIHPLY